MKMRVDELMMLISCRGNYNFGASARVRGSWLWNGCDAHTWARLHPGGSFCAAW